MKTKTIEKKKECKHNFFEVAKMREPFNQPYFEGDRWDGVVIVCGNCGERRWLQSSGTLLRWNKDSWVDMV